MATARVETRRRPAAAPRIKSIRQAGLAASVIQRGSVTRVAASVLPTGGGSIREQTQEVLRTLRAAFHDQPGSPGVAAQTVFLRHPADQAACEQLSTEFYSGQPPVTTFVNQPPCGAAALAVEAWGVGGEAVHITRPHPQILVAAYDELIWVYCGGIGPHQPGGVYDQARACLEQSRALLANANAGFERVVRTWFYLSDITGPVGPVERYMELNRARADFYQAIPFEREQPVHGQPRAVYPASTGVGMAGTGLTMQCLALDTQRPDVLLVPLENPQQTPSYQYPPVYSPESPRFTRAMAAVIGAELTIWVSGTASILASETHHAGDARRQIEQTIENIERLIGPENLTRHGLSGAGARLGDLAQVHVYLRRAADYPVCRALCEQRFGDVPILYTVAEVCRSNLLVEMEGVAYVGR